MNFKSKKISTSHKLKTTQAKKRTYTKKKKSSKKALKFLLYTIAFFFVSSVLLGALLWQKYIVGLPSVSELETLEIAESSTIFDKDENELYKIYKEKRTYIPYEEISPNVINALVAGEDKGYWDNPGVDIIGLFRAVFNKVTGINDKVEGTSTLTQQLIRNTIIKNEKTIERKIKEIYLSIKLTNGVSKEKIIELYLNKIEFGSNAFGIEQAALTFFNKKASELNILEASVLASLPKGPTYYSPYNRPGRLLGYPYKYTGGDEENITKVLTHKDKLIHSDSVKTIGGAILGFKGKPLSDKDILICGLKKESFKNKISIDNDGCGVFKYSEMLHLLNSIKISGKENTFYEYQTGRKDYILGRMLEDKYITFEQYKDAVVSGFGFKFEQAKENIKYPHFVFYVREYLEETYGEEIVSAGGLKVYTTIDSNLQDKAEELIENQVEKNLANFNANNASLISIDNETGNILAMVGGVDYFNEDIGGKVNMTTSRIQPGSTFKPFVYSMGIYENQIGSKTPIYDLETDFPSGYSPSNFDGEFMGKMNLSTALNNSRNIPAIKMFFLAGGEKAIVKFMKLLGVDSLKNHGQYGAPLALGTGEMSALELASAYSVFANMGEKKKISPILKIVDSKGNIIEERTDFKGKQVISESQAYIMNNMLSDTSSRPEFWNLYLSLKGRKVAAKTGTSTKQYQRGGKKEIFPRNLWTVGYTPNITTAVWAGNTDGEELTYRGNGLEGAGSIWKAFMEHAHIKVPVSNWRKPFKVKDITVSEVSGLLPSPENSSSSFLINSLFINKPETYDSNFRNVEVDILCGGVVSELTPDDAKKSATLLAFHSLSPTNPKWENPVQEWAKSEKAKELYGNFSNVITSINPEPCERSSEPSDIVIKSTIQNGEIFTPGENFIELAYRSVHPIIKLELLIGETVISTIELENKSKGVYRGSFFIPASKKNKHTTLEIKAIDNQYYSSNEIKNISILSDDTTPPIISVKNPIDLSIKLYNTDFFNLKAEIIERSNLKPIKIFLDGELIEDSITNRSLVYPINKNQDISVGVHAITIEAEDSNGNISSEEIKLEILQK